LTLTLAQLSGLTMKVPDNDQGNFDLSVKTSTTGAEAGTTSGVIHVTVNPVAEAPSLAGTQTTVTVNEGGSAPITIVDALSEPGDSDSHLGTITISNVPTGVTFNHGAPGVVGNTWTLDPTQLTGLQITVPEGVPGNFTLHVVGTTVDGTGPNASTVSSAPFDIAVSINAAAEAPTIHVASSTVSGVENHPIDLGITLSTFDQDDAAQTNLTISNVPSGATIVGGIPVDAHTWTLTGTQVIANGVTLAAGEDFSGSMLLTVTAHNAEGTGADAVPRTISVTVSEDTSETITVNVSTSAAEENHAVTSSYTATDSDVADTLGTPGYQWQVLKVGGDPVNPADWSNIGGATNASFTPHEADEGSTIRLAVTVSDTEGNVTQTGYSAPVTVTGVPDVPIVSTPAPVTTTENSTAITLSGLHVSPGDSSATDALDTFNVTLSVTAGEGALALTSTTGLTGTFTGSSITFHGSLTDVDNALLGVTYTPTPGFFGSDTLHFSASSTEEAAAGGATSGLSSSTASITVNASPVTANAERLVVSEGTTKLDITDWLLANDSSTSGPVHIDANSIGAIHYGDGTLVKPGNYTVTEDANGHVYLSVANNVVAGGGQYAPDVFFSFSVADSQGHSTTATADIKAVNVTPGNNALDLSSSTVGNYNFSYLDGTKGSDTFIGGAGNNTFIGGGGGDLMKAGSGLDTFVYQAVTDSQPGSGHFDVIQNFVPGQDKIDFTNIAGINIPASGPIANISGAGSHTLNAHSVAYLETGGNTLLLVNTTGASETVTASNVSAANMEIELTGVNLHLTNSDFHHA
jgi:hypothetical protein